MRGLMTTRPRFDYFVIGGGSGGIASAQRAANYGAKVGVAEMSKYGGTCVNFGCVPKKIMWWAASVKTMMQEANHYGLAPSGSRGSTQLDWAELKKNRDAVVRRLNGIYLKNLDNKQITHFEERASLEGRAEDGSLLVKVGSEIIETEHLAIATGGRPDKLQIPGGDLAINSDDFFRLESQPKKVAVIGAGYIAVELSSVFHLLGSDTHLLIRSGTPLRAFDSMIQQEVVKEMQIQKMHLHNLTKISKNERGLLELTINSTSPGRIRAGHKETIYQEGGFDVVLSAIGRHSNLEGLNLDSVGVRLSQFAGKPIIDVDEYQNTSAEKVYALGDVCGKVELTPMAIAAGRRLADRLFGGMTTAKADYSKVPTVVFFHPPIGSIGMTEDSARKRYGSDNIKVYSSSSVNLYYSIQDIKEKPKVIIKMICLLPEEKVVGLHIIGMGADEMLQGFGVAIKMGATKKDFDSCIAIHPTASEEVVTLPPWGLSNPLSSVPSANSLKQFVVTS